MLRARVFWGASLVACLAASPAVWAVNRLVINNATFLLSSTGNNVPVIADLDQDTYGVSIHLQYDAAKVRVTAVQAGSAITGLAPEYFDGTITNSPGRVVYGAVFDLSNPIDKKLTPGANKEVFKLTVDVVAASSTTVLMDLVNVSGNPSRLNVFANQDGAAVSPAPTLVDGTLTLSAPPPPVIQSFSGNSGTAGKEFLVVGLNFNVAGLAVNVCNKAAAFTLLADNQTLRVTAPSCAVGPAEVEVCTNNGCDSEPAGFTYQPGPQPPTIDAVFDNTGEAGKQFLVVGQGFNSAGFNIRVCGVAATFNLLPDNQTAEVTAPACGTAGWAQLQACNTIGCDTEVQGFFYEESQGTPFVRGNSNGDANVDLSDAVYTLNYLFGGGAAPPCLDAADANDVGTVDLSDPIFSLNFLFQGGPDIPPPYPAPGLDPTVDSLGDC